MFRLSDLAFEKPKSKNMPGFHDRDKLFQGKIDPLSLYEINDPAMDVARGSLRQVPNAEDRNRASMAA